MTREELLTLAESFVNVKELVGVKFAYAVSKNSKNLSEEVEACQKSMEPSKGFIEYEEKRITLCKEHCDKDEKGEPVVTDSHFVGLKSNNGFDKAWGLLKSEYAETIEEREKMVEEYKEFLQEEVDVELYKVNLEDVPEDISVEQLHGIMAIVEE